MSSNKLALLLFLMPIGFNYPVFGRDDSVKTIFVGHQGNYPPYIFEKDGALTGVAIEIVEAAFLMMSLKADFHYYPFSRMLKKAEYGEVDAVVMVFKTPEREKYLNYPKYSILSEDNAFFVRNNSRIEFSGHLNELTEYTVGTVAGFSYGVDFDKEINIKRYVSSSHEELVNKVLKNRIDIGLGNKHVVEYYSVKVGAQYGFRFLTPNLFESNELYIGFSKLNDSDNYLSDSFSKAIEKLKESGEYKAILQKYNIKTDR